MKLNIHYVTDIQEERAEIYVTRDHGSLDRLANLLKNEGYREKTLTVYDGRDQYNISCAHIFYIESLSDKIFIHTNNYTFQSKSRLYELEEMLPDYFSRISKSVILNLHKVEHYSPELSGSMKVTLKNKSTVYISRRFLKSLRMKIAR